MNATQIDVRTLVQYTHLGKIYGYLPGMRTVQHLLFGLDEADYARLIAEFDANARTAATELLDSPDIRATIKAACLQPNDTVLAVGDSLTDDLQSWAEILRHALARTHPGIRVVNGGLSAHTSAMILRRWPATLSATHPDVVLCCLGGNDVTRIGGPDGKPQIALDESIKNLQQLRAIADRSGCRDWLWISPATVDEQRVDAFPAFRFGQSTWRNADILALSEALGALPGPLADLTAAFGTSADPRLVGDDGVHPTLDGQITIATAVIEGLTAL